MSTTAIKSLPNLRPAPFLTSGQLSKATGLPQGLIQELVPQGLPAYQLDQRRYVYTSMRRSPGSLSAAT